MRLEMRINSRWSLVEPCYFRKSNEIKNISKALLTKMRRAHSCLIIVMSLGVAAIVAVHENVPVADSHLTPLISALSNIPI